MPSLSKLEKSGTIGMLQAGLRIQVFRDRYQATLMVKDRHGLVNQEFYTSSRGHIYRVLCPAALSSSRQNQRRANCIDQHDNDPAHAARLTVNFQAANIVLVLDRPPLFQDMSAIELLIATLKSKGIAI